MFQVILQQKKRHEKVVKLFPSRLKYVPDEIKAKVMCEKAIERVSNTLQYISDWFITLKVLEDFDNDVLITWRIAYKQSKIWKKQRERELIPITWHPSGLQDWCITQDEKKETGKLWKDQ